MSHWNHRVINLKVGNGGEDWFAVQEVFYTANGKLNGYCNPCIGSETLEGLKETLQRMLAALEHPALEEKDFD